MTRITIGFSVLALAAALAIPSVFGDVPGRHPAYLHARTDLRRAERLMAWPEFRNVRHELDQSANHVREAIREIDAAARWDRKDLQDNPRLDTYPGRVDRFRAIAQFLYSAKRDIEREEDNPPARAWRDRAIHHIDEAIGAVHRAARDEWRDEWGR
ncbi:MAG TPA: hypothetical protein VKG79_01060 [Bryobacteraceae bacterium]|nr:hypothetical protein [Bryobacteraceae bacterium]